MKSLSPLSRFASAWLLLAGALSVSAVPQPQLFGSFSGRDTIYSATNTVELIRLSSVASAVNATNVSATALQSANAFSTELVRTNTIAQDARTQASLDAVNQNVRVLSNNVDILGASVASAQTQTIASVSGLVAAHNSDPSAHSFYLATRTYVDNAIAAAMVPPESAAAAYVAATNAEAVAYTAIAAASNRTDFSNMPTAVWKGTNTLSVGNGSLASAPGSAAFGIGAIASNIYAFVWNGIQSVFYGDRGPGTFNVNPVGGPSGFYIGNTSLATVVDSAIDPYKRPSTLYNVFYDIPYVSAMAKPWELTVTESPGGGTIGFPVAVSNFTDAAGAPVDVHAAGFPEDTDGSLRYNVGFVAPWNGLAPTNVILQVQGSYLPAGTDYAVSVDSVDTADFGPVVMTFTNEPGKTAFSFRAEVTCASSAVRTFDLSLIAPAHQAATNALDLAQQALAASGGLVGTNAVNDLAGVLVSTHNASTVSHADIRESVSNVFDMALGAVKTNAVGGLSGGMLSLATGDYSVAWGISANASGDFSFASGNNTVASGEGGIAHGGSSSAAGNYSYSGGFYTAAQGDYSHAEGAYSIANGEASHAEGQSTANGAYGHSEGFSSLANGEASHAEGKSTTASGYVSHASGVDANATNDYSFCWSGFSPSYYSHGDGTFNINPVGGASGFYIGETNLQTFLGAKLPATYNSQLHTYDVPLDNGVIGQLFQETHAYAMNRSGSTLANGKVVCVSGAQGDNVLIEPASASNPVCTWNVIGLVTEDAGITNNTSGYVCTFGNVNDLNTSMFSVSNTLWLTENGNVTNVEPAIVVGKSKIKIGTVIRSHANEGRIFVSPQVIPNASDVGAMSTSERTNYYTKAEDDLHAFYKSISNSSSSVTSTVSVVPSVKIYRLTTTNSTAITFDTSALDTTNLVATWELWVLNTSTNNSIVWPSTNSVYYLANPSSISANSQTIFTVWRKFGDTIQCNPYLVK